MGKKRFMVKTLTYTVLESMILIVLVLISWGPGKAFMEVLGGTFFFAGLYLIIGSLIISALTSSPSSISDMGIPRVQNVFVVSRIYSQNRAEHIKAMAKVRYTEDPALLYGYSIGLILLFIGILIFSL